MSEEFDYDRFFQDTIKEYQEDIRKYSLKISEPDASTSDYYYLFSAYWGLYKFTKDEKVSDALKIRKETIDEIANKLLVYIKKDIEQGDDRVKSLACVYLSNVYDYRGDKQKALEALDKAVSMNTSCLLHRADYKNYLNDRNGAIADYKQALEVLTDPEEIEIAKFSLKNIDNSRDVDKLVNQVEFEVIKIYLTIAIVVIIIIYQIYKIFVP